MKALKVFAIALLAMCSVSIANAQHHVIRHKKVVVIRHRHHAVKHVVVHHR